MAHLRNPENIQPLEDLQVLVSRDLDAQIGKGGIFGTAWHTVGVLVDDASVPVNRTVDETTTNGAGFGIVARQFKPGDLNSTYETLEDNEVTRYIAWPDYVYKDGVWIKKHSGKVAELRTAIVHKLQNGVVQIDATRQGAYHRMENVGRGMAVEGRSVNVGYVADEHKAVFETRYYQIKEDGTMEDITPKVFVEDGKITDPKKFQPVIGKAEEVADNGDDFLNEKPGAASGPNSGSEG